MSVQVYAKLHSEVSMGDIMLEENKPKAGPRLSKSHADLRETSRSRLDRKDVNSAPHARYNEHFQVKS